MVHLPENMACIRKWGESGSAIKRFCSVRILCDYLQIYLIDPGHSSEVFWKNMASQKILNTFLLVFVVVYYLVAYSWKLFICVVIHSNRTIIRLTSKHFQISFDVSTNSWNYNMTICTHSGRIVILMILNKHNKLIEIHTCGILKSLRRLATWMEVTEDAAPTTPAITWCFRPPGNSPSEQVAVRSTSSMLLMEPVKCKN